MAKAKRTTKQRSSNSTNAAEDIESLTLREVFEDPDANGDSKLWLLGATEMAARDAGVDLNTFITRAVDHFRAEHYDELKANPKEAFRIPTKEEDHESNQISMTIGYLDPQGGRNLHSPQFDVNLTRIPGWEELGDSGDGEE
jgi:hypothetical protein